MSFLGLTMRKADYLILARELRRRVMAYELMPARWMSHDTYQALQSDSLQAASLARYLADHLSVDKNAFLRACGIKPE